MHSWYNCKLRCPVPQFDVKKCKIAAISRTVSSCSCGDCNLLNIRYKRMWLGLDWPLCHRHRPIWNMLAASYSGRALKMGSVCLFARLFVCLFVFLEGGEAFEIGRYSSMQIIVYHYTRETKLVAKYRYFLRVYHYLSNVNIVFLICLMFIFEHQFIYHCSEFIWYQ